MSQTSLQDFGNVFLTKDEDAFWVEFSEHVNYFDLEAENSTAAHGQCDERLVAKIDRVLEPVLGPHGWNDELWFENLDFFGDGVRQLSFCWTDLPPYLLAQLQSLLAGEHELFCILCKFHTERMEKGESVGLLALFHNSAVVTQGLVEALRSKHV